MAPIQLIQLVNYIFILLLIEPVNSLGDKFSFCSENKQFIFLEEACPGGVLLKTPMQIDEPCHCFSSDLEIYELCESVLDDPSSGDKLITHSATTCSISNDLKGQQVQLLIPKKTKSIPIDYDYCSSLPSTCILQNENVALTNPMLDMNEVDYLEDLSPTSYIGRRIRNSRLQKRYTNNGTDNNNLTPNEEILTMIMYMEKVSSSSNELLGIRLVQILKKSKEIFKLLIPELLLKTVILDGVFDAFLANLLVANEKSDGEFFSSIETQINDRMINQLMDGLDRCMKSDLVKEYQFEKLPGCPPTLGSFIHPTTGLKISKEDLKSKMPSNIKYIPEIEDLVHGMIWKMGEAIHAECYGTWLSLDGSVPFNYWSLLEQAFSHQIILEQFYPSTGSGASKYEGILETDRPLVDLMENVDILVSAIHSRSRFPGYFTKPNKPYFNNHYNDSNSRKKRSFLDRNLKSFEIWGGKAYCLQILDPNQLPSLENTFPNVIHTCENNFKL